MATYRSPGVYVEEMPAALQTIAGVGTSTASFIGIVPDTIVTPQPNPLYDPTQDEAAVVAIDLRFATPLGLVVAEAVDLHNKLLLPVGTPLDEHLAQAVKAQGEPVLVHYTQKRSDALLDKTLARDLVDPATGELLAITLNGAPVALRQGHRVVVGEVGKIRAAAEAAGIDALEIQETVATTAAAEALVGKRLGQSMTVDEHLTPNTLITQADLAARVQQAGLANGMTQLKVKNAAALQIAFNPLATGEVKLCTNFAEFRKFFGDFSTDTGHRNLIHAVYGFFRNGGTRCYVARITRETEMDSVLAKFSAIDEIALVAAPGVTDKAIWDKLVVHCRLTTQDRFAIFDSPLALTGDDLTLLTPAHAMNVLPANAEDAAFYFPWIQVFDPATKLSMPKGDGRVYAPPSGHIAGIYARSDATRGVHKAPANEPLVGALGLRYQISKAQQDGLNPHGVNCIRTLNGNMRVWGARTIGGDANGEWRYINVRRTFLYLRKSLDEGLRWVVFEPNDQNLWAKITLNVTAFLTTVWRTGALVGRTAAEAFYVKCDGETNPPALRAVGQMVTEIGVAIVRPAEFVIFRISQWQP